MLEAADRGRTASAPRCPRRRGRSCLFQDQICLSGREVVYADALGEDRQHQIDALTAVTAMRRHVAPGHTPPGQRTPRSPVGRTVTPLHCHKVVLSFDSPSTTPSSTRYDTIEYDLDEDEVGVCYLARTTSGLIRRASHEDEEDRIAFEVSAVGLGCLGSATVTVPE
jgi:hypothetical protein